MILMIIFTSKQRSGEEVYPANKMLSNIPFDIPAPIPSLFQWLWTRPLDLPEHKIVVLVGCRAEDFCFGIDVTKEMASIGAAQLWKTSRQTVMQRISSLSFWGAVTDTSDDVVNCCEFRRCCREWEQVEI